MSEVNARDLEEVTGVVIFGQEFNVYGDINDPLFLAADVAEMIEYSADKVGQMLENVDDNEKLTDTIYRSGQRREVWFLTEYGLYELLMQSRKPKAKLFKVEVKCLLRMLRLQGNKRNGSVVDSDNLLKIENAYLLPGQFKNFSGEPGKYNNAGDRNFCVVIDPDTAQVLLREGWNVKTLPARNEGDEDRYYIKVAVSYDHIPPKVFMLSKRKKTLLDEETIGQLDYAEVTNFDLTINGAQWNNNGKSGVKAWLKTMYATLSQDEFADKYDNYDEDVPFN
jgi:prophage antirepressor-like protein